MVTEARENAQTETPVVLGHEEQAKIFMALSDPTRLQIIELLSKTDTLSGLELAEQLNISCSLVCHHTKMLADTGILTKRKEGQIKYNSLNQGFLKRILGNLMTQIADPKEA